MTLIALAAFAPAVVVRAALCGACIGAGVGGYLGANSGGGSEAVLRGVANGTMIGCMIGTMVGGAAYMLTGAGAAAATGSIASGVVASGSSLTNVGYLAGKAPNQVSPGIGCLEGQYVNDLGKIQPWKAYYDEFGRLIARTDYNAGNITQGIPDIHYHLYEWGPGKILYQYGRHIVGEYKP